LVRVAIIRLAATATATTAASKMVRSSVFPIVVAEPLPVGVGVVVVRSAGSPCCVAYTDSGIAPGPADELEELVAAYGVTQ